VSTTKCVADKKDLRAKIGQKNGTSFGKLNDVPNDVPIIQKINLLITL
jgi:hypothetical protein